MGYIMNLNLNVIIFKSPLDDMIILHHTNKIGGDILNKSTEYFGLFGEGKIIIPQRFKPESILKINEIEGPSWDTFKITKTVDNLEGAKDSNPAVMHYMNAVSPPPFTNPSIDF